jgi:hypothetical protein
MNNTGRRLNTGDRRAIWSANPVVGMEPDTAVNISDEVRGRSVFRLSRLSRDCEISSLFRYCLVVVVVILFLLSGWCFF